MKINQEIVAGVYHDPVGRFWLRNQQQPNVKPPIDQYIFVADDPVVAGWPTASKPAMSCG
jgi:hypothetical protein